jgi:hypothetical protein
MAHPTNTGTAVKVIQASGADAYQPGLEALANALQDFLAEGDADGARDAAQNTLNALQAKLAGSHAAPAEHDQLVNEHQAAHVLGLKVSTLRRWRWASRGPPWLKIGSAVRYATGDLRGFVDAGRKVPVHNGKAA